MLGLGIIRRGVSTAMKKTPASRVVGAKPSIWYVISKIILVNWSFRVEFVTMAMENKAVNIGQVRRCFLVCLDGRERAMLLR